MMTCKITSSLIFCVFICFILRVKCKILREGDACFHKVDGFNGTCVNARRCMAVVCDIKHRTNPQLCSYNGQEPIVCCTDCELVDDISNVLCKFDTVERVFFYKTGSIADDKCLEYTINLDYGCIRVGRMVRTSDDTKHCYGYPKAFFVEGGRDASREKYPHMALLGYGDTVETAEWLCGGTVISNRFILTAAHCIASNKHGSVKYVALGILKRSDPSETWQRYNVAEIIPHPEYQAPRKYHDIALLKTETWIQFSTAVLPACIGTNGTLDFRSAIATGWGALGHHRELAETLQEAVLQKFSTEDCAATFGQNRNLQKGYDEATQTCYGDKEQTINTCPGDSGGPLQVNSEFGSCFYDVIGVTSFGTPCGGQGNPGVYTKVAYYKSWIEDVVWPRG